MKAKFLLFFPLMGLLICPQSSAKILDVAEIVEKANEVAYYSGQDGRADVKMSISDAKGNLRVREFTILRLNTGNKNQKFYLYFKVPADVRKMAYLVWKNADKDDNRWLWLPALNLKKRIAPGDRRTSFAGSDFLYEDVSGRGTKEDTYVISSISDTSWEIKATPKDPATVEFSFYNVWIDKKNFIPLKAEYYNKNGILYRRVEAKKIETIQGYATVTESIASDLQNGTMTTNSFTNVRYDIGLKEKIFTERFLRRPPREVTR